MEVLVFLIGFFALILFVCIVAVIVAVASVVSATAGFVDEDTDED